MKAIGIDLGTTYSVMAHIVEGKPVVIPNGEGKLLTPSVVGWDKAGRVFVGEIARTRAIFDRERTVFSIKREMGKDVKILIDGREYTPQIISAYILRKLKCDAEKYLGKPCDKAVITIPAYYDEKARSATKEAGRIAGFEVLRILNEPTSATLAYGIGISRGEVVMVLDLGGGTFDVSILEFTEGVFQVKSTSGDRWLGGDDWTTLLTELIIKRFERELAVRVSTKPANMERVRIVAETAKIALTDSEETGVSDLCLEDGDRHLHSFHTIIKRCEFDGITRGLLEKLEIPIKSALKDSGLDILSINRVILVGGATRMPQVRELARSITGMEPFTDIDPDMLVGLGAAIQAGIITGEIKDSVLVDVIPLSLGIETRGGIFTRLIDRNSTIPTSCSQIFTTARDNQSEVEIHVLEGERELAAHNISLGRFCLTDIPQLPKEMVKIEVKFTVDADGILNVTAVDVHSNNEQMIQVKSNRISKYEIAKLKDEASKYREQDKIVCDSISKRIMADNLISAACNTLPEFKKMNIPVEQIDNAISESRSLLEESGLSELLESIERLKNLINEARNRKYEKTTA